MADGSTRGAVLVTGASTGIGRACVEHLDRLGFTVFAGVRKESDAESLRVAGSARTQPLLLDVTDTDSIPAAARADAGVPALEVAKVVEHALTAHRPKARYVVGRDAKIRLALSRLLPTRTMDRIIVGRMGL
jgi:NADP-dependent 3-hydroxy acid dehydrogenase YdfG